MNTKDICCGTSPLEERMIKAVLGHIEEMIPLGGEMHFKKGHVLFYEGHKPLGLYVLTGGEIALSRLLIDGKKEDLTNESKDIFGLYHLLTNTPHCAMAVAKSDVKTIFIPKSILLDFLRKENL